MKTKVQVQYLVVLTTEVEIPESVKANSWAFEDICTAAARKLKPDAPEWEWDFDTAWVLK